MLSKWRQTHLSNVRLNVLAGITTVLALIPDSLAFAFIAGVNPMVSLYSTICILILISFFGGRPGMVSSTAGSMAVLMTALVADHGLEYLFAATVLTGIIQFLMGVFRMGKLMRFVPQSVVTGFVNSLAILIFLSQLRYFDGQAWPMYAMVAGTLVIIYLLPRWFKAIPSPLVAIVAMTILYALLPGGHFQSVGDLADIKASIPLPHFPDLPMTWETLWTILPISLSLAIVGYSETLLTQTMIDKETGERTSKDRELRGQGIANTVTGFIGGMAGCALVAESVINVKNGGRTRLSTIVAGVVLFVLIFALADVVAAIPIAGLVGVMMYVCVEIFDWKSVANLRRVPLIDAIIMVLTVVIVVWTDNLALGVIVGVALHLLTKLAQPMRRTEELEG
ncbi:SulP family inorganic anion transporter [Cohnella thailandensis]|uniref:SulP family inorganic anion transporter n=1 Tax=Cohnella thailandensis TaxID=557557 RepID=A0A841SSB6_9BACL|nr:SulP family inorganic anion transporter [Cohnella thailandensis]MBB6633486.1 SulP family inorganic anion transporter [Cohnella thailandensis]MBP1974503.1 SulP family sulfate permease [Cohnella thailandensis]